MMKRRYGHLAFHKVPAPERFYVQGLPPVRGGFPCGNQDLNKHLAAHHCKAGAMHERFRNKTK